MIGAHFALNVPQAQKLFWAHPMELLGDVGHVESRIGVVGDSVSVLFKICAWFAPNLL